MGGNIIYDIIVYIRAGAARPEVSPGEDGPCPSPRGSVAVQAETSLPPPPRLELAIKPLKTLVPRAAIHAHYFHRPFPPSKGPFKRSIT